MISSTPSPWRFCTGIAAILLLLTVGADALAAPEADASAVRPAGYAAPRVVPGLRLLHREKKVEPIYQPPPQPPTASPEPFRWGYFGARHFQSPPKGHREFAGDWIEWSYFRY